MSALLTLGGTDRLTVDGWASTQLRLRTVGGTALEAPGTSLHRLRPLGGPDGIDGLVVDGTWAPPPPGSSP